METDYSPFLQVNDDGSIWWPLLDAVKMGAGYLPQRDDDRNLVPVLRAANNRVLANERTLLSEFSPAHYTEVHPRILVRDETRFVEAAEFLGWLARYLELDPDPALPFPVALACAVQVAKASHVDAEAAVTGSLSLTAALEDWFDTPFCDLPVDMQARVYEEIFVPPWDAMSGSQRRTCAMAEGARQGPKLDPEREFWSAIAVRVGEIENTIKEWQDDRQASAEVRIERERQLPALRRERAMLERQTKTDERGHQSFAAAGDEGQATEVASVRYVAYPKALHTLSTRLGATPDELAAWVFMGPKNGGVAAYLDANVLKSPKRFHYGLGVGNERDFDYVTPLMQCWFDEAELLAFSPTNRYITGSALVERWATVPGIQPEAFIGAKLQESRLIDYHPITGRTQATEIDHEGYPPLAYGLYALAQVEAIEAEDFPGNDSGHAEALHGKADTRAPASAQQIRLNFTVLGDHDANVVWWNEKMANASRNGLVGSRVGEAKRGQSGGSLWRPHLVAGWLLDRAPEFRGGITDKRIRSGLAKFDGYEQAAEDLMIDAD